MKKFIIPKKLNKREGRYKAIKLAYIDTDNFFPDRVLFKNTLSTTDTRKITIELIKNPKTPKIK